jgi:hypothetical protein
VENVDLALRTLGLIFSAAAVALAYIKQRELWMARAKALLPAQHKTAIAELGARMRVLELSVEHRDVSLDNCERLLAAADKALAAWGVFLTTNGGNDGAAQADDGD